MQRVYSGQNTLMVDHLKHVLDAEGIGCMVRNRLLSGAAGRLPPNECWTELWIVDDAQLPAAQRILEKAFREEPANGEVWECPRCGERLEPQFEACWKCCTLRGADPEEAGDLDASRRRVPAHKRVFSAETKLWVVLGLMAIAAWYMLRSFAESTW